MTKPGITKVGAVHSALGDIAGESHAPTRLAPIASIASTELLGARGELKIQHNGETYSLRRTRQGKLILTK